MRIVASAGNDGAELPVYPAAFAAEPKQAAGPKLSVVSVGALATPTERALRADLDARAGRALPARLADAVATAMRRDAAALADAVLSPLLGQVGDRDLVVVPAGILATVPWAVLPGCAGRPVTVAPSATAWHTARHRLGTAIQHSQGRPQQAALLVAGPGNARGDAEVQAIAALRPGASVLTGAAATPAAALAAALQRETTAGFVCFGAG